MADSRSGTAPRTPARRPSSTRRRRTRGARRRGPRAALRCRARRRRCRRRRPLGRAARRRPRTRRRDRPRRAGATGSRSRGKADAALVEHHGVVAVAQGAKAYKAWRSSRCSARIGAGPPRSRRGVRIESRTARWGRCGPAGNRAIRMGAASGARRSAHGPRAAGRGESGRCPPLIARTPPAPTGAAPAAGRHDSRAGREGEGENNEHAHWRPHGGFLSRRWTICRQEHPSGTLQDSCNRLQTRAQAHGQGDCRPRG